MRQLIKRILREETQKSLSLKIEELLMPIVLRNKDYVCDVHVFQDVMNPKKYSMSIIFIGGHGSKHFPHTQAHTNKEEDITIEMLKKVHDYLNIVPEVGFRIVKECGKTKKIEDNEGAGAYDAPAFEMKPDHTTFKHEDKEMSEYSRTLKNARQQGVGLRFPKSAIKSNPSRFRPYNR